MDENPSTPTACNALRNFMEGLQEKLGPDHRTISTREEKREVKREIACEIGVDDDYVQCRWPSLDESEEIRTARRKVNSRYNELLDTGRIEENGQLAERAEWVERIDAHLKGEECFYSEDNPHADWVLEDPQGDPSDGVPRDDPSDAA